MCHRFLDPGYVSTHWKSLVEASPMPTVWSPGSLVGAHTSVRPTLKVHRLHGLLPSLQLGNHGLEVLQLL
ncbi:MAG TPA: hypothetical protein VI542_29885, partial [Candidatus Tectomicrobia bacterium]